MDRRQFFAGVGATLPASLITSSAWGQQAAPHPATPVKRNGRIKQGVTQGVFGRNGNMSLEDTCREAARLGIKGYDFVDDPADWPMLKRYGLVLSMYRLDYPRWKDGALGRGTVPAAPAAGRGPATPVVSNGAAPPTGGGRGASGGRGGGAANPPGWNAINQKEATGECLTALHAAIDIAAANGIPNIILLAGSRVPGLSEEQGADNAVAFCNQAKAHAEDKAVTLCLEIISSKGGPGSYMFDHFR